MTDVMRAAVGPEVRWLQLRLNARLRPSPRLRPDGVFGLRTEEAVRRFQRLQGLPPDGRLTPRTRALLAGPPIGPPPPTFDKFVPLLGTLDDFVAHVARIEEKAPTIEAVMAGLIGFERTAGGVRYLLVRGDSVGVIDFRHFFTAAAESYSGAFSRSTFGTVLGNSPGKAMLLGVGNEIMQCIDEATARKLNSCFSAEDLGTNRLGAEFGELVKVREATASRRPVSDLLREFLQRRQPVTPQQVGTITTATGWETALEALLAILAGLGDIVVPRAY